MLALIDGDILRYEVGHGAEASWGGEGVPPFSVVEEQLERKLEYIVASAGCDSYQIFLSKGKNFRYDIAVTRPYKSTRQQQRPYHYNNLTAYMVGVLGAEEVEGIEADDAIAMRHTSGNTVVCSRDKDLRQLPGLLYSWEVNNQPSFGPVEIDTLGTLHIERGTRSNGTTSIKLKGTGFLWFCSQLIVGDPIDSIPGLRGCGPAFAYDLLKDARDVGSAIGLVSDEYRRRGARDEYLLEQGRLLWLVRRYEPSGELELWHEGLYE